MDTVSIVSVYRTYRTFDISKYRTCFTLHPLALTWHPRVFYADAEPKLRCVIYINIEIVHIDQFFSFKSVSYIQHYLVPSIVYMYRLYIFIMCVSTKFLRSVVSVVNSPGRAIRSTSTSSMMLASELYNFSPPRSQH